MPKLFLSPVGTSLLTNNMKPESKSELYQHANKQDHEIPGKLKSELSEIKRNVQQNWSEDNIPSRKRISAELNGILCVYDDNWNKDKKDIHNKGYSCMI